MIMQNTAHLLMIKPVNFGFNHQTAVNNSFQKQVKGNVQQKALLEFNDFVQILRQNKIDVTVVKDSLELCTPDSIFPNNWISFHADGRIILYPMFAENRRLEMKPFVLDAVKAAFDVSEIVDLSKSEIEGHFLEGTGSMVLDRENKIAYACLSPRTNDILLNQICELVDYRPVTFKSTDETGTDIYHTNVMMCIAKTFVVVCLESVNDQEDKANLINLITKTNKEIVDITLQQLHQFAGNMLQVMNEDGELLLLMSTQAYQSLTVTQIEILQKHNRIINSSLITIETVGGGSARCMIAEIFLERN